MSRPTRARPLALAVLAGTTAVTGTLLTVSPAMAAPVAIEEYVAELPEGTPPTGAEHYFGPVTLTNGDTAYGIHEDQPMAPAGEPVLDDDNYTVAEPFDDPESGWVDVVGEKVGDQPVYWEPGNAALAGYILSVFGSTADADEALAVHWAVRSLSTAATPLPENSGLEQAHLERAEVLIQDARNNVPSVTPQDSYNVSVSFESNGAPDRLQVQMPEAYYATTVTLSGPVTFADGTTTQTFTGGDRNKVLELAVPEGVTEGELTATLTATMPSTEPTVLADDEYRDLFIAGQDRTVTWSESAGFEVVAPVEPDNGAPGGDSEDPGDGAGAETPVDGGTADGGTVDGGTGGDAGPGVDEGADNGTGAGDEAADSDGVSQQTTALLGVSFLFEEQIVTETHVVTETTTAPGGAAYADAVMADTGMGAAQSVSGRSATAPVVLALIAGAAGLGAWVLHRRRPVAGRATAS